LRIRRKRRQEPVHVRLRQRARRLHEKVRQESRRVERVVPVDSPGIGGVEPGLHHDGPNVDAEVENNYREEPKLGPAPLAEMLEVEDESESKATNTCEKERPCQI
jgi:hypothetical protein